MSSQSARSVLRDRSFVGMLVTQFLGVFNDNLFKQIVLFVCLDLAIKDRSENLQGIATVIFALPFIFLSGYCGYLNDLYSKRKIIVISKSLEIVVMAFGLGAFLSGSVFIMLGVLFLMGAQSALFGPAKYGILPELFEEHDLPKVNGVLMMTMFLAIILGFTAAGFIKHMIGDQLWIASACCISIAIVGTLTSLLIRETPIAHPDMTFHLSALIISKETQRALLNDRRLLMTLLATSLFWLTGGVVYPPAINDLGRIQFGLTEVATGQMAACTGLGIAIGCAFAGWLSHDKFDARLVRIGIIGMFWGLVLLALPGMNSDSLLGPTGSPYGLIALGLSAGLFNVPLQAYLQANTPKDHKGRIIGVMNLANFIGIAAAGVYYHFNNQLLTTWKLPPNLMFGAAALLLIPLLLFYHPASQNFNHAETPEILPMPPDSGSA